jgi:predicted O-linked N-acetylglucosamine transferase (SPINDLY family)
MVSIAEAFQSGLAFHAAGDLTQAEQLCRQVLQAEPRHPGAAHLLGLIALQVGQHQKAIEFISTAIRLDGSQPQYHAHLGDAHRHAGQLETSAKCYQRAVALAPHFAEAHDSLGTVLQALGNATDAEAAYRNAIRIRPEFAAAHHNLGVALRAQGRAREAMDSYRTAITLQPTLAESHSELGSLLHEQREFSAAAAAYQEALRLRPDFVEALTNFGFLAQTQMQLDQAISLFSRVVQLTPDSAVAHFNLANVYMFKRMHQQAIAGYQHTLRLQPTHPGAYHNLAVLFNELRQPDRAVEACEKGLALDPKSASLCENLAFALHTQGRGEEAIGWYRKSIEFEPERSIGYGILLYSLNFIPGIAPAAAFAEHLAWAKRHAEPLTGLAPPHANDRTPDRRLRVGYVSAHFCRHAVNYFTEPLICAHDHTAVEVFCYSDVVVPDDVTARLKNAVDVWRDTGAVSDDRLAHMVREDRIDILVDLAGHIGGNRLLVFARKPAPIQVTYIGYQNTTGMSAMDYRLTDERADPPDMTDEFYTEQLVRLPKSFFCYQPSEESPPVTPSPARASGRVTFGYFNNFTKVTPQVMEAWFAILKQVQNSQLLVLAAGGGYVEHRLRELARQNGIDAQRITLCDPQPQAGYMRLIQRADVALDPFPFNGHTTTCDSIWMGVPVVMLEGDTYASRFGGSVLVNVGLEDLIARSVDEYVSIAVDLAGDLDRLTRLREELRPRMAASALLDFAGFARNVEAAYRQMWRTWCARSQS